MSSHSKVGTPYERLLCISTLIHIYINIFLQIFKKIKNLNWFKTLKLILFFKVKNASHMHDYTHNEC